MERRSARWMHQSLKIIRQLLSRLEVYHPLTCPRCLQWRLFSPLQHTDFVQQPNTRNKDHDEYTQQGKYSFL
jgi:hypothetical protein